MLTSTAVALAIASPRLAASKLTTASNSSEVVEGSGGLLGLIAVTLAGLGLVLKVPAVTLSVALGPTPWLGQAASHFVGVTQSISLRHGNSL